MHYNRYTGDERCVAVRGIFGADRCGIWPVPGQQSSEKEADRGSPIYRLEKVLANYCKISIIKRKNTLERFKVVKCYGEKRNVLH